MGQVVWEPTTGVEDLTDAQVGQLWGEVFDEANTSITFYRSGVIPEEVYALKGDGSEQVWILKVTYTSGASENSTYIEGKYYNLTSTGYAEFAAVSNYGEMLAFYSAVGLSSVWPVKKNITSGSLAGTAFDNVYAIGHADTLTYDLASDAYYASEGNVVGNTTTTHSNYVGANHTEIEFMTTVITTFDENITYPVFLGNISDYTFEVDSSWNTAFTIADHFQLDFGINVGVSFSGGPSNANGELINWTFGGGAMKFDPAQGYNGSLEFVLQAVNNVSLRSTNSNYFWVHIVPDVDFPPVFQGEIVDFVINRTNNITILLDQFFEDPDGLDLSYTAPDADMTEIIFGGGRAYLWLGANFTNYESFRIVASDGVHSTNSNLFTVYLDNNSGGADPVVDPDDGSLLVTPDNASDTGALGNGSTEGDSGDKNKIGFWIMVISGAILFLLVVGAAVYFAFFAKEPMPAPVPNNNMTNYLKKIKGGGAPGGGPAVPPVKGSVAGVPVDRSAVDNYLKKINGPQ